jgi:hypothetical protein
MRLVLVLKLLLGLQFWQAFQGLADPLLPLASRPLVRLLLPPPAGAWVVLQFHAEALDLFACLAQAFLQSGPAAKGSRSRAGAHTQAVLCNAVEVHQPLLTQHGDGVGEQRVEKLQVIDAEVGQGVVVDADTTAEPCGRRDAPCTGSPRLGRCPRLPKWQRATGPPGCGDRWEGGRGRPRRSGCGRTRARDRAPERTAKRPALGDPGSTNPPGAWQGSVAVDPRDGTVGAASVPSHRVRVPAGPGHRPWWETEIRGFAEVHAAVVGRSSPAVTLKHAQKLAFVHML